MTDDTSPQRDNEQRRRDRLRQHYQEQTEWETAPNPDDLQRDGPDRLATPNGWHFGPEHCGDLAVGTGHTRRRPHADGNDDQDTTFDNIRTDDETDSFFINYSNELHHSNYHDDNVNDNDVDVTRFDELLADSARVPAFGLFLLGYKRPRGCFTIFHKFLGPAARCWATTAQYGYPRATSFGIHISVLIIFTRGAGGNHHRPPWHQ